MPGEQERFRLWLASCAKVLNPPKNVFRPTPTHIVAGADDITVYVGEDYLLERALTARGIPNTLLIFPGEGHLLDANPWHGKIKVREELKWLEKYGGKSPQRYP